MQVTLNTNLPNAAGESTPKSSELADTGSASSFFAQMGQIWNPDSENKDPQAEGKPAAAASNAACQDSMSQLLEASLIPSQSAEMESVPEPYLTDSSSAILQNSNSKDSKAPIKASTGTAKENSDSPKAIAINPSISAQTGSEIQGIANFFASLETSQPPMNLMNVPQSGTQSDKNIQTGISAQLQTGGLLNPQTNVETQTISAITPDSPGEIIKSMLSAGNSFTDAVSIPLNSNVKSQQNFRDSELGDTSSPEAFLTHSDAKAAAISSVSLDPSSEPEALQLSSDLPLFQNPNAQNKNFPAFAAAKGTSVNLAAPDTAHKEYVWLSTVKDALESAKQDAASSPIMHLESKQKLSFQSGWSSEIKDAVIAAKPDISQGFILRNEDSPAAILKRSESLAQPKSGNANPGDSNANQEQSRDESVARTALSSKLESGPAGSGQLRIAAAESHPEVQSAFSLNTARFAESGNAASVSTAPASATQPREFIFQLADQIRIQLRDGKEEIRIQLKPDSLGRLEIRAETTVNGLTARIATESSNVKSYLENNLQFLQQTLQDQGLKIDRIHIVVQDGLDSQSSSGYTAQFGHAGSGQNGRESQTHSQSSRSSAMNAPDEITIDPITWLALNPNNRFYTVA